MGALIQTLYVDDDPLLLDLTKEFLEGENDDMNVTTCSSAKEVLAILRDQSFDVIISDYQMPTMSGLDLLKELRAHGVEIPFILFTGKGREEVAIDALNNGADFYLSKGGNPRVQFTELMNLVRHMVVKRQAIEAVKHNAERFRAMIENSLDIIAIINPDGGMRYASPSVKKVLGYGAESITGKKIEEMVHPEDRERFNASMASGLIGNTELVEVRFRRGDGTYSHFEGSFNRMREDDGKTYIIFNGREIAKRHKAEELLRESEERYRIMFESSPAGLMLLKGGITECNDRALMMLGCDRSELIGRNLAEISNEVQADGGSIDMLLRGLASTSESGSKPFEWFAKIKGKETRPFSAVLKPISVQGEKQFLISFTEKVQEKEPEERSSVSEETCRTLLTTTQDSVLVLDRSMNITFCSPRAGRVFGHGPDMIGTDLLDLVHGSDREQLQKDLQTLLQGVHTPRRRYHFLTKDEAPLFAELSANRVPGPEGQSQGLVCIFHDVTENVVAEENVISANRHLSEMGEMTRLELQKRLTAMMAQLQLLQFMYREPGAREQVESAMEQAAQTLKFLEFARSYQQINIQPPQWFFLRDMVDAALVQARLGDINLDINLNSAEILTDPCMGNAMEHLFRSLSRRGGNITSLQVRSAEEMGKIVITVTDNGPIYGASDLSRLFEMNGNSTSGQSMHFVHEVVMASGLHISAKGEMDRLVIQIVIPAGKWRPVN
jgi:PAS domain S-box-containing protein